ARLTDVEAEVAALKAAVGGVRPVAPGPAPGVAPEPESPEPRPSTPDLGPIQPAGTPPAPVPVEAPAFAAPAEHAAAQPALADAAAAPPPPQPPPMPRINWEQFMGVKLFAWVGGLALFLGVAFFVKYSFEHDLVPPELRVALGFLTGLGLLVGGLLLSR